MSESPFFTIGGPEAILLALAAILGVVCGILPFWMIFKKAGFHPALSLLMILPVVNFIMLLVLAFAPWPALEKR